MVVSDAGGLPSRVIARGIGLIQLISVVSIPSRIQKRHTERTLA